MYYCIGQKCSLEAILPTIVDKLNDDERMFRTIATKSNKMFDTCGTCSSNKKVIKGNFSNGRVYYGIGQHCSLEAILPTIVHKLNDVERTFLTIATKSNKNV